MTELLITVFGDYTMQFVILIMQFAEIFLCTLLFCWYFKRKRLFVIRLIVCIIASFALVCILAVLRTEFNSIWTRFFTYIVLSAITLGFLFLCYNEHKYELILCWSGGIAAFQATAAIIGMIYSATGSNDNISLFGTYNPPLDWFMYYFMHLAIYLLFSFIFSRKKLRGTADYTKKVVLLSTFTVIFMIIVSSIYREYESSELAVQIIVKLLFATLYILILLLRTGIFTQSKYKQDLKIMDELLREEKKQFERVKDNIEIINMKCHDLKHHLSDLEGKISEAELAELRGAIEIYDTSLKTGNDILDVVLYEKSLICERENIRLDCLADGKALGFMNASHIYSLFGNAVDNAIEAVRMLPDPEKRTINITVGHTLGLIEITVANRFFGERKIENGNVATSKDDSLRHGYGIKSIKYIASLYDGNVDISIDNDIFTLRALIPPQYKSNAYEFGSAT